MTNNVVIIKKRSRNRPSYNTRSYIKCGIYTVKTFEWGDDSIKTIIPRSLMLKLTKQTNK